VRIIAATNEDLDRLIRKRHFRKDLYYRIRGAWLHMPPLRERREDIPFLIAAMLGRTNGGASRDAISEEALDVLMRYEYPGNVRELESIIHSAASLAQGQAIDAKHLHPKLQQRQPLILNECRSDLAAVTTLAEAEKCHILKVYEKTGRNKTQSAKILGIGLNTLRRKLKSYGLGNDDV
jgi:transcriptional regulator with PAS, ATPase and Fis domain